MEVTKVTYPNFKKTPPFIEKKDIIDERGFVNVQPLIPSKSGELKWELNKGNI